MSYNLPWNSFADDNLGDQYVQDSGSPSDFLPPPDDTQSYETFQSNMDTLPQSSRVGGPYVPPGYGNYPDAFDPSAFMSGPPTVAATAQSSTFADNTPPSDFHTLTSYPQPAAAEHYQEDPPPSSATMTVSGKTSGRVTKLGTSLKAASKKHKASYSHNSLSRANRSRLHHTSQSGSAGGQKKHSSEDLSAIGASGSAAAEGQSAAANDPLGTPKGFVSWTLLSLQRSWESKLEDLELAGDRQFPIAAKARSFAQVEAQIREKIWNDIGDLTKGNEWVKDIPKSYEAVEMIGRQDGQLTWQLVSSDKHADAGTFYLSLPDPLPKRHWRR